ncbi:formyltetrahydrofolate deformylase [Thermovibrio ammonificans]|jgi:formyltetrahydrofolate deformylase|uniref:Formyltetrahydrofolate deformylase n=1 Tax=Thermovibrio ammonificans (strain DSM 15698 / JCM 12110 / HB-1) TaxID=648996 RepID=E8T6K9_THEA1|nr:formyltetrahydrofolate deformylase [Thermovibrio ammonificans]ADU96793.1 formyltetrahydrofolate deformylase [Thermovibrio ammonificans HB-1]
MAETATLLISCPDRKGILAEVTGFIARNGGNILHADQHIDFQKSIFFMRIEWDLSGFKIPKGEIEKAFRPIAQQFKMNYQLHFSSEVKRVAIFVSKYDHCLYELLYRFKAGELKGELVTVISNHRDLQPVVEMFGVPFVYSPKSRENKREAEEREIEILEREGIDLIVLARYMQILSDRFVNRFRNRIINIHHSFLPAFVGAKPYHRAYERGVKIIGATSHYVTEELDQGPIIEQDVVRVTHRDSVEDMIRKGRDLEKLVLARAVKWHLENKVLVYDNKTVIFE